MNIYYIKINEFVSYIENNSNFYTQENILNEYDHLKKEIIVEKKYLEELIAQLLQREALLNDFDKWGIDFTIKHNHENVNSFYEHFNKEKIIKTDNWDFQILKEY